jgi:hypothetical protein
MNAMRGPSLKLLVLALALQGAAACSDATLGVPAPPAKAALDNRLSITGSFCTQPATQADFPVKIIFVVDLSNSMCYSDPAAGYCTALRCDSTTERQVGQPPRRLVAVQSIIDQYATNPAVLFSVVPFSASIHNYPSELTGGQTLFTKDVSLLNLDELRNVDSVTDYQGVLSTVKSLLSDDMSETRRRRPSELPRTKYAVVFLTDGTPFPHCSRGDPTQNDPPDAPNCDSHPETCTICQVGKLPGDNFFPGLQAGEDYNENYQLIQLVNDMHKLGDSYNVGELKFHAAELRVDNAVVCCPGCFAADPNGTKAATLLKAMGQPEAGLGSYTLFRRPEDLTFVDFDFTSLQQQFVARSLIVDRRNAVATNTGLMVDSDGDGISDDDEFRSGTNRLDPDTNHDGYSDLFATRYKQLGLDPFKLPAVACNAPTCPGGLPCDTDGDGLNDCEELLLGTDPELVDSDGDGIPDGLEVRLGMDPTRDDTHEDLDFDGISNIDEVLAGSSVTQPDTHARDAWVVHVSADEVSTNAAGGVCYNFAARDILMPSPLSRPSCTGKPTCSPGQTANCCPYLAEPHSTFHEFTGLANGWNDTYLWLGEAPRGDVKDYGRFRVACVRTRWIAPDVRLPLEPSVTLKDSDFKDPSLLNPAVDCVGTK